MAKRKKKAPKRVQGPKSGKVIRVDDQTAKYLEFRRRSGETWGQTVSRLLDPTPQKPRHYWTLPSKVYRTKNEALGISIAETAQAKQPLEGREEPVKIMEAQ